MRTIKFMFEYNVSPIWIYEENDSIPDFGIPKEPENTKLNQKIIEIQNQYNDLFINNEYEFSYYGFESSEAEKKFFTNVYDVFKEFQNLLYDKYNFVWDIDTFNEISKPVLELSNENIKFS